MDEKSLITEVQKHKILYNVYHAKYWWKKDRNKAWVRIGTKLHSTARECALRWSKLRNIFTVILQRRRIRKAEHPDAIINPWRYERRMAFLLPFLKGGLTLDDLAPSALDANVELDDSEVSSDEEETQESVPEEETQESVPEEAEVEEIEEIETKPRIDNVSGGSVQIFADPSAASRGQLLPATRVENIRDNNNHLPEGADEIDMFYLSIAKTVKKLPPVEQARLRMTICNIVSEAEIRQSEVNNYFRLSSAQLPITPSANYYNN